MGQRHAWIGLPSGSSAVYLHRRPPATRRVPALAVMLAWGVIAITDNAFDYYAPFTQFAGFLVGAVAVCARDRHLGPAASSPASLPDRLP